MGTPVTVKELTTPPNLPLSLVKGIAGGLGKRGGDLPAEEYRRTDITVDPDRVAEYCRVCEYTLRDDLPPLYPHLLAFPMSVALMSRRDFPFPLPGLIHVANRVTLTRPIGVTEPLTVRVAARDQRPHDKGRQFDIVATVDVAGETVWTGTSTYLRRGGGHPGAGGQTEGPDITVGDPSALWSLPGDLGRRYARVSGDHNPIHLYPVTARLFGFRSAIAHGMWTKARALAALEGRLPSAYTVDVRFKLPIPLPSGVGFAVGVHDAGFDLTVTDRKSRPHLVGTIRP